MTAHAHQRTQPSQELMAILQWTARIGAVTAEALAHLHDTSVPSARARLRAATRRQVLARHRLLVDRPALYTVTRAGTRVAGLRRTRPRSRQRGQLAAHDRLRECRGCSAALLPRAEDRRRARAAP